MKERHYSKDVQANLEAVINHSTIAGMTEEETACELVETGNRLGDSYLVGYGYYRLATLSYERTANLNVVYDLLRKAIDALRHEKNMDLMANAYILAGVISSYHSSQTLAVDYLMRALKYGKKSSNPAWFSGLIMANLGTCYHSLHDNDTAVRYILEAIQDMISFKEMPNYCRNMVADYILCAHWMLDKDGNVEAAEYYARLTEEFRSSDEWISLYSLELQLLWIHIYQYKKDYKAIMKLTDQVMPVIAEMPLIAEIFEDVCSLLSLLIKMNEIDKARELIDIVENSTKYMTPATKMPLYKLEIGFYEKTGDLEKRNETAYRYFQASIENEHDSNEATLVGVNARYDQEKVMEENRKLLKEAETDQLTQIPNRYSLNKFSDGAFARAYKNQTFLAVEILDIDEFKHFNDMYGHNKGDECLRTVSDALRSAMNEHDGVYAARYGGDEFVVIYENKSDDEIKIIGQKLQHKIRSKNIYMERDGIKQPLTISQGIINAIPSKNDRVWSYITVADKALYRVKRTRKGELELIHDKSI